MDKLFALLQDASAEVFFGDESGFEGDPRARQKEKTVYLVLEKASWHKVRTLVWHHINPLYLPPYSSDLNPIERLWQHLKSHDLAGFVTNDYEASMRWSRNRSGLSWKSLNASLRLQHPLGITALLFGKRSRPTPKRILKCRERHNDNKMNTSTTTNTHPQK